MGETSSKVAAPLSDTVTESVRAMHDEAIGWVKIGICRKHLEALANCQESGVDCSSHRAAVRLCKDESEQAAWRQLQENAVVQCPQAYSMYVKCMADGSRSIPEAMAEERTKCKPLWIAMQHCAAEHVVNHIQSQSERQDGGFTPPQMYAVRPVRRRRAEDMQRPVDAAA